MSQPELKKPESNETISEDKWPEDFENEIIQGDSASVLKKIPDKKINLIVTSPPYFNQRKYKGIGKEESIEKYLNNLSEVFKECVRITKDDGSIVFNLGDKYNDKGLELIPYRFAIKVLEENEDIKLPNVITWVKKNPTPRQFKRRLVNSTEPFFHFVKSDDYYYDRDAFLSSKKDKDKTKKIEERKNSRKGQGYFKKIEESPLSDEEKEGAKKALNEAIEKYKRGDIEDFRMKIRGVHALPFGGKDGGRMTHLRNKGFTIIEMHGNKMKKDVIECSVETDKGKDHPAVYPEEIIIEIIKLLTRRDDVVLDPFIGSGTTAAATKKLGRKWIGIDINEKYCETARERVSKTKYQSDLSAYSE